MPENKDALPSFTLTWRNAAYYVSKPNIGTCEVVRQSDALARIEQLQAEISQEKQAWHNLAMKHIADADALKDELAQLQAENERLMRDAERYRGIRSATLQLGENGVWTTLCSLASSSASAGDFDAALDAAMQAQKEQG